MSNSGHGHVFPRTDGVRARCGGPAVCKECALDLATKTRNETTESFVLVISNGYGKQRAEGPFDIDQAVTRRHELFDKHISLYIEIVMMGNWDES